ncbi:MAG: ATP-binding protein [Bacteroidota bacterium]
MKKRYFITFFSRLSAYFEDMNNKVYIPRYAEKTILKRLELFPATVLIGPRQVGKTSLVQAIRNQVEGLSIYLDLERPRDLDTIDDLEQFTQQHQDNLVILDEIQRKPSLFPELRGIIDRYRRPGRFILLGSASLSLIRDTSESLAGRISIVELSGLDYREVKGYVSQQDHWLRGGFPDSLLSTNLEMSRLWRQDFLRTYLERDLRLLGLNADPVLLRRLFTMLAHLNGQTVVYNQLSNSLGINVKTLKRYLSFMEQAFLIRSLPAYSTNIGKRLVKSPKLYVRDTGIVHELLRIGSFDDLLGHPKVGESFESYVIEEVFSNLPEGMELFFYRTQAGAEVDLIVVDGLQVKSMVEIKISPTASLGRGFYEVEKDLKPEKKFLVTLTEDGPYTRKDGTQVIGLNNLDAIF